MNPFISLLAESALKGTVVLAVATLSIIVLRQNSAAWKYAVWFSALMGLLVIPLVSPLFPGFQIIPQVGLLRESTHVSSAEGRLSSAMEVFPSPGVPGDQRSPSPHSSDPRPTAQIIDRQGEAVRSTGSREGAKGSSAGENADSTGTQAPAPSNAFSPTDSAFSGDRIVRLLPFIWLTGAVIAMLPLFFGYLGVRRLARRSTRIDRGRVINILKEIQGALGAKRHPVRLLLGSPGGMPMTWGTGLAKPATILLPAEANEWSEDRLRGVLLHEFAHIRRRDCLTQVCGRLACALYWFHPWVWIVLSRMLVERERACDDIVLRHSRSASIYARDIVEIASQSDSIPPVDSAAIAMARPNKVDTRVRAILDPRRNRNGIGKRLLVGLVLFTALISLPVASLQWAATPALVEESREAERPFDRAMDLRLIDPDSGQPVSNADVQATNPGGLEVVETEEEGRWLIELPDERSYFIIKVYADGFAPVWLLWNNLQLKDPLPESHTLTLERGTPIGGRVVGDAGEPVAGATVEVRIDRERTGRARLITPKIETDEEGRWEYPVVPEGVSRITIGAYHPDYASHSPGASSYLTSSYEPIADLRDGTATYVLKRGILIEGVVVDPTGAPMEGVGVGIGPERTIGNRVPEFLTDAEGRFRLRVHPDEEVVLFVNHPGFAPSVARFHSNERPEEVRIQLSPGRTLTGQVVNSEGPIAGATVVMWKWRDTRSLNHRMRTDEEGRFEWNEAPEDTVLATVHTSGYAARRDVPVQVGEENIIHITSEPTVRGTVTDAETGEPIQQFNIATPGNWFVGGESPEPFNWEVDPAHSFESGDGSFEITLDGNYHLGAVRVEVEGYAVARSDVFAVEDGDQVFSFELEREDWVTAHVTDSSGFRAAAGAKVFLAPRGDSLSFENGDLEVNRRSILQEVTDSNGRFSFPPQNGEFLLVVLHETGYAEVVAAEIPESRDIILQPWARIEGKALIRGEPASRYEISSRYIKAPDGSRRQMGYSVETTADSEGRFVFERVPAGEIRVNRIVRDRSSPFIGRVAQQNPVTMEVGGGETGQIQLGGTGRPVIGRVSLDPLGSSDWVAPFARVTEPGTPSRGREEFLHEFVLRSDGSFQIEDLEPGDYSVRIGFEEAPPGDSRKSLGNVSHEFTVPEFDGAYTDEPHELPLLQIE